MTQPRLAVILRQSFEPGDTLHRVLRLVDEIVIHAHFDGPPKKKQSPASALLRTAKLLPHLSQKSFSVFIPTNCRTAEFLEAFCEDVLRAMSIDTVLVEVNPLLSNESVNLDVFVTKLFDLRPDFKVGLVSPWRKGHELSTDTRITNYIIIEKLQDLEHLPEGSVPVLFSLLDEEKAGLFEYLTRYAEKFPSFLFWSPRILLGVNLQELQETQTRARSQYEALYPLAKREGMSLNARVSGALEVGKEYSLSNFQHGSMGVEYAKLDESEGGNWVVFSQSGVFYFKEIYHEI